MKIRMVETRSHSHNVYDQSLIPRLGLPQIGAILTEQGHDVRIYVETLAPVDMDDLLSADLVGFSTTTATTPPAFAMADKVRQAGIPVVFGGAHVTFLPDQALEHADYVVRGEGHATMVELIDVIEGRREPADVPGLSYHGEDGLVHTPDRENCSNAVFAELPVPDLSLIVGNERMGDWPVMTQWGCPFNCNFCSVIKMFGRKVRHRPVEAVLEELENVPAGKSVFFYDDNFVVDKKRTKALLRGMKERGFKFPWSAQVRAEMIYKNKRSGEWDTELLDLMRDTFCKMVYVGYESVNPAALEEYNKQQTVEEIAESIRAFHDYGIHVHGMFVLGCDADTVETIRSTVSFAIRNGVDTVQFLTITPLPGTDFYYEMEAANRIISDDWSLYDGHHVLIEPANMTPYELQMESFKAMLNFYAPRRAWKMLAGNVIRELPFLIGLFFKERKLRLALPKIAWMSLSPKNWLKIPKVLSDALDIKHWLRLRDVFLVPFFRRYAFQHTREGLFQPQNQKYIAWLRKLAQGRRQAGGMAS
ncbi:MAG: cobalamin-dependent protein [Anaerolineae bacterium]|nr:cobalamin-dependent protein [Anaerolineae bacterium]